MNYSRFLQAILGGAVDPYIHMVYHKGDDEQSQTTVSKPFQQEQYKNLLGEADKWLSGGGFDPNYGGSAGFDPVADLTGAQKAGISGMTGTGGALQDLYTNLGTQSIGRFLGDYDPSKTGLKAAQQAAAEQAMFDFETGQMGNIRQGAQGAGQYGSTRAGIAEGLARGRLAQGIANQNAQMAFQDQQAFNQSQLGALGNLAAITKGLSSGAGLQYDAGALEQQQQQKEIQGALEKWAYENNVDLNNLLAYKQLITGDMGGRTTTTASGGGGGGGLGAALGAVGGAALGGMFGGPMGAMAGSQAGSQFGAGILG